MRIRLYEDNNRFTCEHAPNHEPSNNMWATIPIHKFNTHISLWEQLYTFFSNLWKWVLILAFSFPMLNRTMCVGSFSCFSSSSMVKHFSMHNRLFYLFFPLSFFLALWFCSFYSNVHLHGQQLLLLLPWNVNYTIITLKYIDMRKIGAWLCRYEIKNSYNCPGERNILSHFAFKTQSSIDFVDASKSYAKERFVFQHHVSILFYFIFFYGLPFTSMSPLKAIAPPLQRFHIGFFALLAIGLTLKSFLKHWLRKFWILVNFSNPSMF